MKHKAQSHESLTEGQGTLRGPSVTASHYHASTPPTHTAFPESPLCPFSLGLNGIFIDYSKSIE